jgi:hypothetical protein
MRLSLPFRMTLLAIVAAFACTLATQASATNGRTAVGMCIDSTAKGARCAWSVNDKGEIDICNKNGCVTCPSATSQCSVTKQGPRPTRGLPVGTKVITAVGTFTVR